MLSGHGLGRSFGGSGSATGRKTVLRRTSQAPPPSVARKTRTATTTSAAVRFEFPLVFTL
ncbi:hypothetical protein [Amycolatopsis sp. NPDC004169]|uniref:hypothetical protein n=1 Tax=Amycolatopsis sp. NPDC004169 TaxID=3154453 RepID=UPI0033AF1C8F